MIKKPCIYVLTDPDNDIERHVGKTDDPCKRYRQHLSPYELRSNMRKSNWIKFLLKQGKRPGLKILMICEDWNWEICEQFFIALHRIRQTHDVLTNHSDGGNGRSKGYKMSEKSKRKISEANKGYRWSKEAKKKISEAFR